MQHIIRQCISLVEISEHVKLIIYYRKLKTAKLLITYNIPTKYKLKPTTVAHHKDMSRHKPINYTEPTANSLSRRVTIQLGDINAIKKHLNTHKKNCLSPLEKLLLLTPLFYRNLSAEGG